MKIWPKRFDAKHFRSTLVYTLTSFFNQFGNLLVLPVVWKGLTIEDFAVIGLIEAATPFLACVLSLSSEQYVTRFYFTWSQAGRRVNIGKNLTLSFLSVVALGLLSFCILLAATQLTSINEGTYYLYGLAYIVFFSAFAFPTALFRITNSVKGYVFFTVGLLFMRLLLGYWFTIEMSLGLHGYILSMTITSLAFFIFVYVHLFTTYPFAIDFAFFREALRFSVPFIPTNLMTNISTLADRLVLSVYGTKFETGLLTLGQKVASIPGSLSQALKLGYVPYITEFVSQPSYAASELNRTRMLFIMPVSVTTFFLMLFGIELLALIGIRIAGIEQYLYLLLLVVYLNANNLFFAPGLYLSKRSDKMWLPNILQLLMRFSLYILLVPIFVLKGVVLASLFASLIAFVYNYYLSEKYFRLGLSLIPLLLQFLPFLITIILTLFGIDILTLHPIPKGMIMTFYIGVSAYFLFGPHEKTHI